MRRWTWVFLICAAAVACGDDDANPGEDAGPDGAGTGGGGTTAGTGGGGGTGGTGTMTAEPVPCGTTMCQQPMSPLGGLGGMMLPIALPTPMACCFDEATAECGLAPMADATCESLAEADDRCPDIDLGALGAIAGGMGGFGCCTPTNQCGVDGAAFGRGCVENTEAAAMLSAIPLIGTFLMVPGPRACDAPADDGGVDDDGGL